MGCRYRRRGSSVSPSGLSSPHQLRVEHAFDRAVERPRPQHRTADGEFRGRVVHSGGVLPSIIPPFLSAASWSCAASRAGVRPADSAPEQDQLPPGPLADLDLGVFHCSRAADRGPLSFRVQPADPPVAGGGCGRNRDRGDPRTVTRRRAGPLHRPLHRGPAESALSACLLHAGMERSDRVRGVEYRGVGVRALLGGMEASADVRRGVLSDRHLSVDRGSRRVDAAGEAVHARRRARAPILSMDRSGRSASRSRCCGSCGRSCQSAGRRTP